MRTQKKHPRLFGTGPGWVALLCLAVLAWTGIAAAQLPAPGTPWGFDITGFIQEAKLDGTGVGALQGGHLRVNGHLVTVPSNTVVVLPGNQLTWQELFAQAPAPYGPTQSGMASADLPAPLAQYEAHVIGNVLPGASCTILNCSGEYIAGLVYISQQGSNSGTGYINAIDYVHGELIVGGAPGNATDGVRVRLNDPLGQYGLATPVGTTDLRFSVGSFHPPTASGVILDSGNPTIRSVTGFPMCLPRAAGGADAACPETQRPALGPNVGTFTTVDPALGGNPSPLLQAPFEVGDYITFAGTLVQDCAMTLCPGGGPTAGPYPVPAAPGTLANTFISAHTIINNIAIYTAPGTDPAYVAIDVALMGTGGITTIGLTEAAIRTRFEGFTTDVNPTNQRNIHLYGVDLACNGTVSANRDWGTIGIDPGGAVGAAKGRWRFRPPCTGVASTTTTAGTVTDKICSPPANGVFDPPPRDVRAVLELPANPVTATPAVPAWTPAVVTPNTTFVIPGTAHVPITDYIFPEQVAGAPVPPINIETLGFLANGGMSSTTGTLAGQLFLWPGIPTPSSTCAVAPPSVTISASPLTVAVGSPVTLTATVTGTGPFTFLWNQTGTATGTFTDATTNPATWTATGAGTATFTVAVTNAGGTTTSTPVNVTVVAAVPAITSAVASPSPAAFGTAVTLTATATGATPMTFAWVQVVNAGDPVVTVTPVNPPADGSVATFTAPAVSVNTTLTFAVTATNAAGTSTPPTTASAVITAVGGPTVSAIATQTVTVGAAVSIPVTVTTTNTVAKLTLAATPSVALTNFKVNGPSQTCTTTGCLATFTITFTAPTTPTTSPITIAVTATDTSVNLTSPTVTATVNVTAPPPVVQHVTPITVTTGTPVTMNVTATSLSSIANLTLQVNQTNVPALTLTGFKISPTSNTCNPTTGCTFSWAVQFTHTLAAGQATPDVINFAITATDISVTPNLGSATEFTSVTVNPVADTVAIQSVEYRISKQRLIINASSSVVSPAVVLTLQPYLCQNPVAPCVLNTTTGQFMYTPANGTFTNNGGGLYIITLVNPPPPACTAPIGGKQKYATPCTIAPPPIVVKSSLGGSASSEVTKIRTQ